MATASSAELVHPTRSAGDADGERRGQHRGRHVRRSAFVSFDIEADGASPALHSCLQIGFVVAAHDDVSPVVGDHSWILERKAWCLEPQAGKVEEARCMSEFWAGNAPQLAHIRAHAQPADVVADEFQAWLAAMNKAYDLQVWCAKPASYDSMWLNALLHAHGTAPKRLLPPFSVRCISTMLAVARQLHLDVEVHDPSLPHTHDACDDAAGQAFAYKRLHAAFKKLGAGASASAGVADTSAAVVPRPVRVTGAAGVRATDGAGPGRRPLSHTHHTTLAPAAVAPAAVAPAAMAPAAVAPAAVDAALAVVADVGILH